MLRVVLIPMFIVLLTGWGYAQDDYYMPFDEDSYVTEYFGTSLVAFMTEKLDYDSVGWWTEALPEDFTYEQYTLIEKVNAARAVQGRGLLDENGRNIIFGYESETDGGWEYDINFYDMRPDDVRLILDEFGGAGEMFPGGQFSFLPCIQRDFNADTESLDEPIDLLLGDRLYSFDARLPVDKLYDEVEIAFLDAYGQQVYFDLYVYSFANQDGTCGAQMDIYAELPAG